MGLPLARLAALCLALTWAGGTELQRGRRAAGGPEQTVLPGGEGVFLGPGFGAGDLARHLQPPALLTLGAGEGKGEGRGRPFAGGGPASVSRGQSQVGALGWAAACGSEGGRGHQEGPGSQSWVAGALGGSRPRRAPLQSRLFAPLLRGSFSQRSPCECRTGASPPSRATGGGGAGVNPGPPSEGSGTVPLLSAGWLEPGEGALAGASEDREWQRPG